MIDSHQYYLLTRMEHVADAHRQVAGGLTHTRSRLWARLTYAMRRAERPRRRARTGSGIMARSAA